MPDPTVTLFFSHHDPDPIARPASPALLPPGWAAVTMPGAVTLHGPAEPIRAWLQAGLNALADGTVVWGATEAVIAPEHPSVNHAPTVKGFVTYEDAPLCGATGRADVFLPVTCPACLKIVQAAADAAEVDPDA